MSTILELSDSLAVKGPADYEAVHTDGTLHRSAAVLLFTDHDYHDLIMAQRANGLLIHPGKWDVSAGGHVKPQELIIDTAYHAMSDEVLSGLPPKDLPRLNLLTSYSLIMDPKDREYQTLYVGVWPDRPHPNPDRVQDTRIISLDQLRYEISHDPTKAKTLYTPALIRASGAMSKHLRNR